MHWFFKILLGIATVVLLAMIVLPTFAPELWAQIQFYIFYIKLKYLGGGFSLSASSTATGSTTASSPTGSSSTTQGTYADKPETKIADPPAPPAIPSQTAAGAAQVPTGALVGSFNADNYLKIKLNGVIVFDDQDKSIWTNAQQVNIPNVKRGDRVEFVVKNAGGPGGFIGNFTWLGTTYSISPTLFAGQNAVEPTQKPWLGSVPVSKYPDARWTWTLGTGTDAYCENCINTYLWIAP